MERAEIIERIDESKKSLVIVNVGRFGMKAWSMITQRIGGKELLPFAGQIPDPKVGNLHRRTCLFGRSVGGLQMIATLLSSLLTHLPLSPLERAIWEWNLRPILEAFPSLVILEKRQVRSRFTKTIGSTPASGEPIPIPSLILRLP